jgi:hypothetical protein
MVSKMLQHHRFFIGIAEVVGSNDPKTAANILSDFCINIGHSFTNQKLFLNSRSDYNPGKYTSREWV